MNNVTQAVPTLAPMTTTYRVSLAYLGEAWQEAYVELRDLAWNRAKELRRKADETTDDNAEALMAESFAEVVVGGQVPSADGTMIKVTAEMLNADNFPLSVLGEIFSYVIGSQLPKASMRLKPSTPVAAMPQMI
jgi:hypothetical protein